MLPVLTNGSDRLRNLGTFMQNPNMKKYALLLIMTIGVLVGFVHAQTSTYILLRHAEKDTSAAGATMMKADPPLSEQGKQRAEKLVQVLANYTPDEIYSTNYIRTQSTVAPLSKKFNKSVELYDNKNLKDFSEKLLQLKGKTVVVAGHSNTTPRLVNLLIGENRYPDLDERVYDLLWIVTVAGGKAEVREVRY